MSINMSQMPRGGEGADIEKMSEEFDKSIVVRANLSQENVDAGGHSSLDSAEIARLDEEIVSKCREICKKTPNQTPQGLLAVALRQLVQKNKISQERANDIMAGLENSL